MYDKEVIGRRIKECRVRKGFTQQKLGELTLFSRSKVSNLETGRNYMSVVDALILCEYLDIRLDTLFDSKKMSTADFLLIANDYFTNKKISKKERDETLKSLLNYF